MANEADSEWEDYMTRKYMDRIIEQLNNFQPYMYEPERIISNTSSSNEDSSGLLFGKFSLLIF